MKKVRRITTEIYGKILYPPFRQLSVVVYPVAEKAAGYHCHPQVQTVMVERGCLAFEQPDHQVLECRAGELLTIPAGVQHRWMVMAAPCRAIQVIHTPLPLHFYGELFVLFGNLQRKMVRLALPKRESCRPIKGIRGEVRQPAPGGSILIHGWLLEIFALAVRQLGQGKPAVRLQESICRALNYIEEHLAERMTLQDLAAHSYLSASRFSHIFQEFTGQSPIQYINGLRIERAKGMLLFSNFRVSETAARLGFDSIYYFSRLFKKITGCSPSEFAGKSRKA